MARFKLPVGNDCWPVGAAEPWLSNLDAECWLASTETMLKVMLII